jgi:hypothetical protein
VRCTSVYKAFEKVVVLPEPKSVAKHPGMGKGVFWNISAGITMRIYSAACEKLLVNSCHAKRN